MQSAKLDMNTDLCEVHRFKQLAALCGLSKMQYQL